jgi:hypothetical protein
VIIEATVEKNGALTHPVVLRTTAPYTNMVLDAIAHWRFAPAHAPDAEGHEQIVESKVVIAALYRGPITLNGPTIGSPPADVVSASTETPYPVFTSQPSYPPQARAAGVVQMEVALGEAGIIQTVRTTTGDPTLEGAARDAVAQWKFRSATLNGRAVPSTAYVIMGFPEPMVRAPVKK